MTSDEHQDFAEQLSEQGTVLLKNDRRRAADRRPTGRVRWPSSAPPPRRSPIYTGGGSATVVPVGHRHAAGRASGRAPASDVDVTYAQGTAGTAAPPLIDTATR